MKFLHMMTPELMEILEVLCYEYAIVSDPLASVF